MEMTIPEQEGNIGRVVTIARSGRTPSLPGLSQSDVPFGLCDHFQRKSAGTKQEKILPRSVDNGRFDTHVGGAAVEEIGETLPQVLFDGIGVGGTGSAASVGTRSGDGKGRRLDEGQGDGMGRHAEGHRLQSAPGNGRNDAGPRRKDEGERARPEKVHEAPRPVVDEGDALGLARVGEMKDERIVRGAALGAVNGPDRLNIEAVGPDAVDGLGGKGDELTPDKSPGRLGDDLFLRIPAVDGTPHVK
jgi:hypothetical protein